MTFNNKNKNDYYPLINIKDVGNETANVKLRGLVISKSSLRLVRVNYDNSNGMGIQTSFKGVFNFTLRDSVVDFINITSWGNSNYSKKLFSSFHIGDIISISNVNSEKTLNKNIEYRVQSSSNFNMIMNEKQSTLEQYFGSDRNNIMALQNTLLYPMSDHVTLLNMILYMESLPKSEQIKGQHFTFLAMIRQMGEPSDILSKTQKDENNQPKVLHKLDIVMMDESCKSFPLTIWDLEWIHYVKTQWIPKVTSVSLVDCKVKYDEYKRGIVGLVDQKTMCVVNPDIIECSRLHNLVSVQTVMDDYDAYPSMRASTSSSSGHDYSASHLYSAASSLYDNVNSALNEQDIPLTSIQNVATIKAIRTRTIDTDYVIVYGILTSFPIDEDEVLHNFIRLKCRNCHARLKPRQVYCTSIDCPMLGQNVTWNNTTAVELEYNTIVTITDHTGTINKCSLSGEAMTQFVNYTPQQMVSFDSNRRSQIKWNFLLNRYKFYIKCATPSFDNSTPITKILGIHTPTVYEVMTSVKQ